MINVLIAEDSHDVRQSLINILKMDPEIRVVGEAENGAEAVAMAMSILPDLILMDIKLPGLNGLEAAKRIKVFCSAAKRDIKILILSTFYDDDFVSKAQKYGVDGYLLKGLTFNRLASAIKNTCNGLVTLDRIVYEKQRNLTQNGASKKDEINCLTRTELKVLKLVVSGKKNAEIAAELFLSEGTVRNYISSMLSKLRCKNSRDLAVWGIKAGL